MSGSSSALLQAARLVGLSVLLALAAPSVQAMADGAMTLGDLQDRCGASDAEEQAACRFFILGAFQGIGLAGSVTPGAGGHFIERKAGKTFCVPEDLAQSAMVQRVVSLAKADVKAFPEDAQMPAISFVASVVIKAYPCH